MLEGFLYICMTENCGKKFIFEKQAVAHSTDTHHAIVQKLRNEFENNGHANGT